MKKTKVKILSSLLLLLLMIGLTGKSTKVLADAPYKTYTIDGYGDTIETQTAYLPYGSINKIGDEFMKSPTDFTILDDGCMYILDSGNKRVLVSDMEGNFIASFGEDLFVKPRGMYVSKDHICYVADRDAKSIFVFDENYKLIHTYTRPTEALYGETQDFLPIKIVANDAGTMYVVCESNTNGIVEISPVDDGTFLGYFGTNSTNATLWTIIWRAILTDAQRAKMIGNIPATPDNLAIDDKGIIYTVTRGEGSESLKRLNIAGSNMIEPDRCDDVPAAVAVGNHDNVYVVSQMGYIYKYNNEGELLFVFGGSDDGLQRIGLTVKAIAIQVDKNDKVYVLDEDKAEILIYETTEFANNLHKALFLFSKGRYLESEEPLRDVLKMNNLFDYANMAMGRTLYKQELYEEALHYARLAKDMSGYSDSFWEIRNTWLKSNLATVIVIIIVVWAVLKILGYLDRRLRIFEKPRKVLSKLLDLKYIKQVRYMFFFMKHPIDGCYGIKRQGMVSVTSANIVLALGIIFYIINKYFSGFLIKGTTVKEGNYDIFYDAGTILIGLVLIVGCNYLMCTINDGEGKLKSIYCSFIYSFAPYLVITPVIFALSHVVTNNEIFFIEFGRLFMWTWVAILVFVSIREINNFKVSETFKIIGLTIFTILIACLLAFIVYVLWAQVIDFIQAICGEVVYKIGN
ncbi:MAG: hypothetical protein K6B75_09365 [Lachnospiraceae bacterium]|nr:hypothetical protein [Lachnospiraceae bacterium]